MAHNSEIHLQESEMKMDIFQEEINNSHLMEEKEIEQQKSLIAFKGLSKVKIKEVALLAVQSVLEAGNPLEIAEALSSMELFIKEVKSDVRFNDYVREELEKSKTFISTSGAKLELAETGTKYDFSLCNDSELLTLLESAEKIKEKIDTRQKFLKNLPIEGVEVLNKETGELEKVYPPSKSSTSGYKVTLSK
jgi:hypothetical protein